MKFVINFFLLLLVALHAKAEVVLRFQTHINTHAKQVGDLLLIIPDKKHWSQIKLDSQPKVNETINKEQLISWLQHTTGMFNYQWKGKKTARISPVVQARAKDLMHKAEIALQDQLIKQGYSDIKLNSKSSLKDSDIPLAAFTTQIAQEYPVAKRVCVHLNYQKRSIPVWFSVKAYQKVLVARHLIKAHTLLQPDDVLLQTRNVSGFNNNPLTEAPKTTWLNKSVNKNQILTQEYLSNPPDITEGQKVNVNVREHGVSITITALAQNNGYIGQEVRMKNSQTNKYFLAVIVGKNQAEIAA